MELILSLSLSLSPPLQITLLLSLKDQTKGKGGNEVKEGGWGYL
jgi:hypothetical protein